MVIQVIILYFQSIYNPGAQEFSIEKGRMLPSAPYTSFRMIVRKSSTSRVVLKAEKLSRRVPVSTVPTVSWAVGAQ